MHFLDFSKLSNFQLHVLLLNPDLDEDIRNGAKKEFNKRNIGNEGIQELEALYKNKFKSSPEPKIATEYKFLLVIFPFLSFVIWGIIAGKMLAKGHLKKTKEFWNCITLGYLLWTVIALLIARYYIY